VDPIDANQWLVERGTSPLTERQPLYRLARRPQVTLLDLVADDGPVRDPGVGRDALTVVEMEIKYEGYIRREEERARALAEREDQALPDDAPYMEFRSLSYEARQKLESVRPKTVGQAGRIPGVSPSDLQNLLVEVRKHSFGGAKP
jgi:tRNA uridine 5-carboxymethylaminomethyl modification enzyme